MNVDNSYYLFFQYNYKNIFNKKKLYKSDHFPDFQGFNPYNYFNKFVNFSFGSAYDYN